MNHIEFYLLYTITLFLCNYLIYYRFTHRLIKMDIVFVFWLKLKVILISFSYLGLVRCYTAQALQNTLLASSVLSKLDKMGARLIQCLFYRFTARNILMLNSVIKSQNNYGYFYHKRQVCQLEVTCKKSK